jgi:hypothetical protein
MASINIVNIIINIINIINIKTIHIIIFIGIFIFILLMMMNIVFTLQRCHHFFTPICLLSCPPHSSPPPNSVLRGYKGA